MVIHRPVSAPERADLQHQQRARQRARQRYRHSSGPFNQDIGGTDQFSGRSIAKVLVHPTNPDIIFVGTGAGIGGIGCNTIPGVDSMATSLRPRGLYRSTNATSAGPTFTKLTVATE